MGSLIKMKSKNNSIKATVNNNKKIKILKNINLLDMNNKEAF